MDADEAFVGAVHLIHYPQADWAAEEWIYWKGPWRSLLLVWTLFELGLTASFHPLGFGVNFIVIWRLLCSHYLWWFHQLFLYEIIIFLMWHLFRETSFYEHPTWLFFSPRVGNILSIIIHKLTYLQRLLILLIPDIFESDIY